MRNRMKTGKIGRRTFLERMAKGGLGAYLGLGAGILQWRDRGVSLRSVRRSSLVMGSVIDIRAVAETEKEGYEAIRRALKIFRDLDRKLSMYRTDSEMGRLAQLAGREPLALSGEALRVLDYAKEVWKDTGGAFDVTVEPAMRRWGFRVDPQEPVTIPSDRELKRLERLIGSDKLLISSGEAFLEEAGMAVDLGGIAGGYALDRAIAAMKKADLAAAFINFSGDIHCFGTSADEEGWPVYLLDPRTGKPTREPVVLRDEALSTSATYQNRRQGSSDVSWGHLLRPGTASPVASDASVTAVHPSAMKADAWSTAGFVGEKRPGDIRWIVT